MAFQSKWVTYGIETFRLYMCWYLYIHFNTCTYTYIQEGSKQYPLLKAEHHYLCGDLHQKWREWQCMSDLLTLGIHQWKTSSSPTQNLTPRVANSLLSPCILLNYEKRKTKCPCDFIRYFNFISLLTTLVSYVNWSWVTVLCTGKMHKRTV